MRHGSTFPTHEKGIEEQENKTQNFSSCEYHHRCTRYTLDIHTLKLINDISAPEKDSHFITNKNLLHSTCTMEQKNQRNWLQDSHPVSATEDRASN